ncbi:helix-turn-helix domain-containing protein [Paenibacillus sedimenti]|uniref:AraC family transcriptional regulator n=1 Tax=Paenibacillus sedimenti TaxID=2770274 RepID=A0A926KR28_9BACL|nr:helix-turn-helix domain-containing protein [Paenibacillus sedimenti]MBD0381366.1 AraC family transcriptional regulator [Paenibacillus sedimenti]
MYLDDDLQGYFQGTLLELVQMDVVTDFTQWPPGIREVTHHTLLFFIKTRGQLLINREQVQIQGKTLCLLLPGTSIELLSIYGNENSIVYHVEFDLFRMAEHTEMRKVFERELSFPVQGVLSADLLLIQRKMHLLASAHGASSTREHLRQQYLYELLEVMLRNTKVPVSTPKDVDASLQLTIQYMQDAYQSDIQINKLAEIAGMHPAYYSQRFKQKMNKTPIEFLTQVRMNRAKEALLVSAPKIRDVARQAGYQDEFYFSRRFKENSGYAPTHYAGGRLSNIVSLSYPYTDHLLTLGVIPSAAQFNIPNQLPPNTRSLTLPLHASDPWEISRQSFLEAKPDLILCKENVLLKAREHLSDIAPIISIPWSTLDVFDHLEEIAQIVDRRQAAKEWINLHEYNAERARKQIRKAVGHATIAICRLTNSGVRMYGARNVGHVFYRSLHMDAPDRIRQEMEKHRVGTNFNWIGVSPEEIYLFESDFLIILIPSGKSAASLRRQMMADPSWLRHPAVRNERVFFLQWDEWMVYAPQSINRLVEKAVALLTGMLPASELKIIHGQ